MKEVGIKVGVNYFNVPNGHEPGTYVLNSDVVNNIDGKYGICGLGSCVQRWLKVFIPDWIEFSTKFSGFSGLSVHMCRPGYGSKSGSLDLCFIVCKSPVKNKAFDILPGNIGQDRLIDEALSAGLELVYPDENGDMLRMDVEYKEVESTDDMPYNLCF